MISWVQEKFAERRARWVASRKTNSNSTPNNNNNNNNSNASSSNSRVIIENGGNSVNAGASSLITNNSNSSKRHRHSSINRSNCPTATITSSGEIPITSSSNSLSTPNSSRRINLVDQKQHHHVQEKLSGKVKFSTVDKSNSSINQDKNDEKLNIKIRSPIGKEVTIAISKTAKIFDLKKEALDEFVRDSNSLPLYAPNVKQLYSKYRFIRPESQIEFQEELTIDEAGIQNNETLNLCIKRTNNQPLLIGLRGPTITEITLATLDVPQRSVNRLRRTEISEFLLQAELHFDVRKVIISLAQSSAYIIGAGPYASKLIEMFKQKLINKRKYQIDTLQCLVDMGFSKEKASYALKIHNGVYSAALDWLIEHQNDEHIQIDDVSTISQSASRIFESNNYADNIHALLEIVRIYSQRDMPAPPVVVNSLVEMGFQEKDVIKALRVTRNNQAAACDWLCGNRSSSLTELREGLSTDSPIYKKIMDSPQVQISLGNPKMFIAYLSMLENHNALSMWLGDSDTSSVLSHILRKYHEEKHILGTNQINTNHNNSTITIR